MDSSTKDNDILIRRKINGTIKQVKDINLLFLNTSSTIATNLALDCAIPTFIIVDQRKIISIGAAATLDVAYHRAVKSDSNGFIFITNRQITYEIALEIEKINHKGIVITPRIEESVLFYCLKNFTVIELEALGGDNAKPPFSFTYGVDHIETKTKRIPSEKELLDLSFAWFISSYVIGSIFACNLHTCYITGFKNTLNVNIMEENVNPWDGSIVLATRSSLTHERIEEASNANVKAIIAPEKKIDINIVEIANKYEMSLVYSK